MLRCASGSGRHAAGAGSGRTRLPCDPRSALKRRTTSAGGTTGRLNTHGKTVSIKHDCNDLFDRQTVRIEDCLGCACLQRSDGASRVTGITHTQIMKDSGKVSS